MNRKLDVCGHDENHAARCQVSMEERLSQSERRVVADAQKQFDLELAELRERLDAVHKVNRFCVRVHDGAIATCVLDTTR